MLEQLDMSVLIGLQSEPGIWYNMLAFGVGLAAHIGKKCFMEKVSLRDYLAEHKMNTYLSMGGLLGAFTYMHNMHPDTPILMYALGGYCIDSLMNKAPLTDKRLEKEVKGE